MSKCEFCDCQCGLDIEDTAAPPTKAPQTFSYAPLFQHATTTNSKTGEIGGEKTKKDHQSPLATEYIKLENSESLVKLLDVHGRKILEISPSALTTLAHRCVVDIQHFFRHDHLQGWANILNDPEADNNEKFVAMQLLKNAVIASKKMLPSCQDTGTAIVMGKRGEYVWTEGRDEEELARGIWEAYTQHNLRYSQVAAVDMFTEANTKSNMPAQLDILASPGRSDYEFLFICKGGGSANKSYLYQETKALLNPKSLKNFIIQKLKTLGTAACPPYHLALVIGGTSAEMTMKTVKLASCRYYDDLPTTGDASSGRAFRDLEWEGIVMDIARNCGVGAQFGGKYFAHQARVIRLPRHGASCPVGLGVSCSADRQIKAKITSEGMFIEKLIYDPSIYMPKEQDETESTLLGKKEQQESAAVKVDLTKSMSEIRKLLSSYPVKTRLSLTGPMVVARDIAHAKLMERLEKGEELPNYAKDRIIYYAGPAKTPQGFASGSFGPTTAGRMDSYVGPFMAAGGSFITLAKGNRSPQVTEACQKYGGFYLGSIGGPAAILGLEAIKKVEVLEYPELGMEAVFAIDVVDFPAFILVDDKGKDFYGGLL